MPRLLYGLEIQNIKDSQLHQLDLFQLKSLKQLQWLPERCSNAAVHLLLGAEPVPSLLDKKILSFFGQITRDRQSLENQIAYRQIAMYDLHSKSWFSKLKTILAKYNLPDALTLLEKPMKKAEFKKLVDEKVNSFWMEKLIEEKNTKTSLNMMSTNHVGFTGNFFCVTQYGAPSRTTLEM